MQWPNFTEFFSTWLRGIAYGKEDGTAGATQRAQPILVDSNGVVQVSTTMTVADIHNQSLVCGAGLGLVASDWVDHAGYKMICWFVDNVGANPTSAYQGEVASGLAGAGIAATTGAVALVINAGVSRSFNVLDYGATLWDTNVPWSPLQGRSHRLYFNCPAGSTIDITTQGINW